MANDPILIRTPNGDEPMAADSIPALNAKVPGQKFVYGPLGTGTIVDDDHPFPVKVTNTDILRTAGDVPVGKVWVLNSKPIVDNDDPDAVHDGDVVCVLEVTA